MLDGVPLPALLIDQASLRSNARAMRDYVDAHGMLLAPHVKTHMSPELWRVQEEHGAVAATVATASQLVALAEAGVRRFLVANEVVAAADLALLAAARREHGARIIVFADSVAGVGLMDAALAGLAADLPPLDVLVDFGLRGRRTGTRTAAEALAVAEAVHAAPRLRLRGLGGYEGVLWSAPAQSRPAQTDAYLDDAVAVVRELLDRGLLAEAEDPGADPADLWTGGAIVSFGGSDLYPAVADRVRAAFPPERVRIVLRSGCYLTLDHGRYRHAQQTVTAQHPLPSFEPALQVWGTVLSAPESGLAVVGVGKRDLSYDDAPPVTLAFARDGVVGPLPETTPAAMFDQHIVLHTDRLAVGDLVGFGVSHPCTTFDKWREARIVDDEYRTVSRIRTLFH